MRVAKARDAENGDDMMMSVFWFWGVGARFGAFVFWRRWGKGNKQKEVRKSASPKHGFVCAVRRRDAREKERRRHYQEQSGGKLCV